MIQPTWPRRLPILIACFLALASSGIGRAQNAAPQTPDPFALPATDDGLPGAGPIRRYDWFQQLWRERRVRMGEDARAGPGRGRVPRRFDHAGVGRRRCAAAFPGVKIANRGISGDTTRGVLIRLQDDVLALNPKAVVLLIGTNDLEEDADAGDHRRQHEADSRGDEGHNPQMPVVLCQVFPSSLRRTARPTRSRRSTRSISRP